MSQRYIYNTTHSEILEMFGQVVAEILSSIRLVDEEGGRERKIVSHEDSPAMSYCDVTQYSC